MTEAFDSLAAAARASFPGEFCRIVAMQQQGDAGYVLFDTRPNDQPYLYGVSYERDENGWREGSSGNGPGWSHVGPDRRRGTMTSWGQAPSGADRVRVEFDGDIREDAVVGGVYLVIWWNVPYSEGWPVTRAFRVNGEWIPEM